MIGMISIGTKTGFKEIFSMEKREITYDLFRWVEYLFTERSHLQKKMWEWESRLKGAECPNKIEQYLDNYKGYKGRLRNLEWSVHVLEQFSLLIEEGEIVHAIRAVDVIDALNYVMTTYSHRVEEEGENVRTDDNSKGEVMQFTMHDMLIKPSIIIGCLRRFETEWQELSTKELE